MAETIVDQSERMAGLRRSLMCLTHKTVLMSVCCGFSLVWERCSKCKEVAEGECWICEDEKEKSDVLEMEETLETVRDHAGHLVGDVIGLEQEVARLRGLVLVSYRHYTDWDTAQCAHCDDGQWSVNGFGDAIMIEQHTPDCPVLSLQKEEANALATKRT